MEHTEYHQLCLWDPEDRILREDFNADNAKTEAALADLTEAVAGCGNCQIYTTSYVGTGQYSSAHQITITCPKPPKVVLIHSTHGGIALGANPSAAVINQFRSSSATGSLAFSWNGNTVSWYGTDVNSHMNVSGTTYYVTALLAAD